MNLKKRKSAYELNLRYYYLWPKIIEEKKLDFSKIRKNIQIFFKNFKIKKILRFLFQNKKIQKKLLKISEIKKLEKYSDFFPKILK